MTRKNSTKRALVASLLAMVMTVTMLMGTTFAWFTDSVTSSGNVIKTGTLDVAMYWKDGKTDPAADSDWTDASTGAIFNYDLWEPGFAQVRHVKIANEGTLDLKYTVKILANGTVSDLADAIDVYYADPAIQVADRAALAGATKIGTLTEVLNGLGETGNGTLTAKTEDVITLALVMQEGAGNQYMDKSIGTTFSVQVLATQLASESDSFDGQYDADATYPVDIAVSKDVTTDADGKTTEATSITYADPAMAITKAEVLVPAGAQLADGVENLVFKVKQAENVNDGVAALLTSEQTATTYEISLEGIDDANTEDITVTLTVDKGMLDVKLYHEDAPIPCTYDPLTGELSFSTKDFSPFTVVSATKLFEEGAGTAEDPYIIAKPADLYNISKYYHEYSYFKVADGVETLDLSEVGNLKLYGSFDGNGAKFVNLSTSLFQTVGKIDSPATIKLSNMDVTVHTTNGRSLVRNIFNPGETVFENISMHGYLEGQYNIGSFYNYGTANAGGSSGTDYTVSFVNAKSDVTLVCTTGNALGGMLGHGYEGANNTLSVNMDENSGYTGKMYTTGTATCYQVMAMCSHATYVLNGVETSRYENVYPSTKLSVAKPEAGADGYYVTPADGVDHYVVYLNAQLSAYDENGVLIADLAGMTGNLGNFTVTEGFDGKLFDLIENAVIVNGTEHDYSYEMKDGNLTVYTGKTSNYASGWITLQVNQYDENGTLLATGIITVYTVEKDA